MLFRRSYVVDQFQTLFGGGTIAGLTDAQLLDRFTTLRGQDAELAFTGVVARHGPMVLGVCRGLLRNTLYLVCARVTVGKEFGETPGQETPGQTFYESAHVRPQQDFLPWQSLAPWR